MNFTVEPKVLLYLGVSIMMWSPIVRGGQMVTSAGMDNHRELMEISLWLAHNLCTLSQTSTGEIFVKVRPRPVI